MRFEQPVRAAKVLEVNLNLYRRLGDSTSLLAKQVVALPSTGFKFQNLELGEYLVVAYVKRHHCQLQCEEQAQAQSAGAPACEVCPHTMLNFTLSENKFTEAWKRLHPLVNAGRVLVFVLIGEEGIVCLLGISIMELLGYIQCRCVFKKVFCYKNVWSQFLKANSAGLFALVCLLGLLLVLYLRLVRPKLQARRPAQQFELSARPHVLLLYADDCAAHSECALQLALFLRRHANADVHLDQWDLVELSVRPSVWLQQQLQRAQFVLLLFSEGASQAMEGRQLRQQRPFPDLFNAAVRLATTDITRITNSAPLLRPTATRNGTAAQPDPLLPSSAPAPPTNGQSAALTAPAQLGKYVALRFEHSAPSVVPDFFHLAQCASFSLPADLKLLVAHLHHVPAQGRHLEFQAETADLDRALAQFRHYRQANPDFLQER